jgi:zinc and cadmium transporter
MTTPPTATLLWILGTGLLMSAIALVGAVTLLVPQKRFARVVLVLVALAAGSLLGGALFHLVPAATEALEDPLQVQLLVAVGFVAFLALEQLLHWHHCLRPTRARRPIGYLVLVADGLHNLIGGLAVGSAFVIDVRLGLVTWAAAAAHEIPQELGDFGLLVHSGWSRRNALLYNVASALTFPVGGVIAYLLAGQVEVALLLPFAAGSFLYIAAADHIPEFTAEESLPSKLLHTGAFVVGLSTLYGVAVLAG